MGLNIQNEIDLRKDILDTIANAKIEIKRRATKRDAYELAEYEASKAKHEAKVAEKEAQRRIWDAANVEKAAKRAAVEARKELKRVAQAAQAGATEMLKKKTGMPKKPVTGPRPDDQVNLTDEESRIMPVSGGGYEQCYNAQAVVAEGTMLVMAAFVTQASNDKLLPCWKPLLKLPKACLLWKLYCSIRATTARLMLMYVTQEEWTRTLQPVVRTIILTQIERFKEPPPLPEGATPVQKMAHKLKTIVGRKMYALRKQTVEPVFGIIKSIMGFRQFSMRGLETAENEWNMVCLSSRVRQLRLLTN